MMLKETIDHILGFTETLKGDDFNEAVTKHFVVLPILRDLGWNCDNLENLEVFPDKSTESGTVDYALQHDGKPRVFIVVKRWPTGSGSDELYDEIASYVSHEEVDFVVLTNGKTWHFYLPNLPDVPWKTRRFCSIELDNGDEAVSDFQKYLSKPHVLDASAREEAEAIVKAIVKKTKWEKPNPQELLRNVRKIIREIEDKSAGGDYIFRGEPECYEKVSSTLYRQYEEILIDGFNVEGFQNEMLTAAQEHLPGTTSDFETPVRRLYTAIGIPSEPDDYFETLTELQHYGGKTNLIDFTTDSRVALFFACDGSPGKKGRVILRKRGDVEDLVEDPREPSNPLNRVIAQKSIFVRPRRGFVEFDRDKDVVEFDRDKDVVEIPADLKKPMLEYLHKYHNISAKTIYNDLHGFIRIQDIHHEAYEEFYRGLSAEDKGKLDKKAILHYNRAIELKPDFFGAYNNRGIAYGKKGNFDSAIKDFNKAIELNPNLAEAYSNRGNAYDRKGELDNAFNDFTTAIELNPVDAIAYNNRGTAYLQKGELDNAIKDLTTAIKLKPDDADTYYDRGNAYAQKGELDNAIKDLTTAIKLKPDDADAYSNRGTAYAQKGELDNAIKDLTTVIKLKPDDADTYYNRGNAYIQKGELDNAIKDLTTVIKLKPDYADAYNNRGTAYAQKGELDNAIKDFTTAIKLKPDYADAYNNRGIAYREKGEFNNAIQDYDTAIKLKPDDADTYYNRGNAYIQKGELDNAIKDFTTAIKLKPDYADAYSNRGTAYAQKGELDNAIKDLTQTIELKPDFLVAYYNRGVAHSKKDEFDKAIQNFDKAIQLNPVDAIAYYYRGKAWMHLGKWDKAKTDLTDAKDLGLDIIASFQNDYESVADFEQKNDVQVPPDLAEMLTRE